MLLTRFDNRRLRAVPLAAVGARRCAASDALVATCRQGATPADLPWALLSVDNPESARRACLLLDGSWAMADATAAGRWLIRGRALRADLARWRPARDEEFWDAGWARDTAALRGFVPRRATLIVVEGPLEAAGRSALHELEQQATAWRHAVRVLHLRNDRSG
jgi:hypothetical protein